MADDRVWAVAEAIHRTPLTAGHEQSAYMPPNPSGWEVRASEAAVAALDAYDRRTEADLRERLAQAVEAERDFWLACDPDSPKPPQRGSVRWAVARAYDVAADTIREAEL